MPAPKSPDPKSARATFRAEPDLLQRTRTVAAARGISHGEFLRGAVALAAKQYSEPVERREIISDCCELARDCSDEELLDGVRAINAQAADSKDEENEGAKAKRSDPTATARACQTSDLEGNAVTASEEESDRLANLRREFGLNIPAGPERSRLAASARRALAARGESVPRSTPATPRRAQAGGSPVAGLADLSDVERAEAEKITDPAHRARFVAARLARKAGGK